MRRDSWNPDQYERFRQERRQPFLDLLGLIDRKPGLHVIDLGCGTGELTRTLHEELGAAQTVGIDNSESMLSRSDAAVTDGLTFTLQDIEGLLQTRGRYDVIFSNAALHWLPDHPRVFAELTSRLNPGGQLAIQVPANDDHPSHLIARQIAVEDHFYEAMNGEAGETNVLRPEEYSLLLHRLGFSRQTVRMGVYGHLLPSREAVLDWVRGTVMTRYESRLSPEDFGRFIERYRERLFQELEDEKPFFYPFKRILIWAEL
jgi:Trans-aconitate methyltransferase